MSYRITFKCVHPENEPETKDRKVLVVMDWIEEFEVLQCPQCKREIVLKIETI